MNNDLPNIQYSGSFLAISDDDYLGVVVGLEHESRFYLILGPGSNGYDNHTDSWRIVSVASTTGPDDDTMVQAILSPESVAGQTKVLYTWPDKQWSRDTAYLWVLEYKQYAEGRSSLFFMMMEEAEDMFLTGVTVDLSTSAPLKTDRAREGSIQEASADRFKFGVFSYSQQAKFYDLQYQCI